MAQVCDCDSGIGNLGTPNCIGNFGKTTREIRVPLRDSTGALNYIDPAVTIDAAFLTARLNDSDTTTRWYPTPEIKNYTSKRATPELKEYDDGSSVFLRDGVREVSGIFVEKDTTFLSKLEASRCVDFGVYYISDSGAIMGDYNSSDGYLYPIAVQNPASIWNPETPSSPEEILFSYQFSTLVRDCDLRYISGAAITADLKNMDGLIDVNATISNIAAGSADVVLTFDYGSLASSLRHSGVLPGDVQIEDLTTPAAPIAVSAFDESVTENGLYSLTHTLGAGLLVRLVINKDGFDYTPVLSDTFTTV